MRARATLLGALSAVLVTGCIVDHDSLAVHGDGTGGAQATASGGALATGGGTSQGSGGTSGADAASDATDATGGKGGAPEPGPRKLTFLHGVTDAPFIYLCFTTVDGTTETSVSGSPVPPAGIEYAHHATVTAIPGVDLSKDSVRVHVVAADAADVLGMDCPAMLAQGTPIARAPVFVDAGGDATPEASAPDAASEAGATDAATDAGSPPDAAPGDAANDAATVPKIRLSAMPVIPAGALAPEKSYLLTLGGCLGGVTDPSEKSVCGELYAPDRPTLTPYLVAVSRIVDTARVGLQFVDGTPAFRRADIVIVPTGGKDPIPLASDVPSGGIRPLTPYLGAGAADLAPTADDTAIQVLPTGDPTPAYDEPWAATLATSDLPTVTNGKGYTLVLIGPYPGFSKRAFWQDPVVAIVPNDPE